MVEFATLVYLRVSVAHEYEYEIVPQWTFNFRISLFLEQEASNNTSHSGHVLLHSLFILTFRTIINLDSYWMIFSPQCV